jgi:hypothetical protein
VHAPPSFPSEGDHATEGQPAGRPAAGKVSGRQEGYVHCLTVPAIAKRLINEIAFGDDGILIRK